MAKIRTIKPEFFRHEGLFEAEQYYQLPLRLAFAGLFTCCDREGRFRWRPRQLKLDIMPYDTIDFSHVLDALATRSFIVKYEIAGEIYGYIPSWHKHQHINNKEVASNLPSPTKPTVVKAPQTPPRLEDNVPQQDFITREARDEHVLATQNSCALESLSNSEVEVELEMEGKGNGKELSVELPNNPTPDESQSPVQSIITITLNDKTEFPIFQNQIDEWQELYPAIDVLQTLRIIRGWNLANVKKRKTKAGILKHITGWLANEQNRGGIRAPPGNTTPIMRNSAIQNHNLTIAEQWLSDHNEKIIEGEIKYDI